MFVLIYKIDYRLSDMNVEIQLHFYSPESLRNERSNDYLKNLKVT